MYLLRLSDPGELDQLCDFLRRVRVDVVVRPDGALSAAVAGAPTALHELQELTGYVATWNALNAHSRVELFEPSR